MLDELIDRYGSGAVITASPLMVESGENYRWELMIDGEPDPDVHAHERGVPGRADERVLLLVYGDDEVELTRWLTRRIATAPLAPYGRSGAYDASVGGRNESKKRYSSCQYVVPLDTQRRL